MIKLVIIVCLYSVTSIAYSMDERTPLLSFSDLAKTQQQVMLSSILQGAYVKKYQEMHTTFCDKELFFSMLPADLNKLIAEKLLNSEIHEKNYVSELQEFHAQYQHKAVDGFFKAITHSNPLICTDNHVLSFVAEDFDKNKPYSEHDFRTALEWANLHERQQIIEALGGYCIADKIREKRFSRRAFVYISLSTVACLVALGIVVGSSYYSHEKGCERIQCWDGNKPLGHQCCVFFDNNKICGTTWHDQCCLFNCSGTLQIK